MVAPISCGAHAFIVVGNVSFLSLPLDFCSFFGGKDERGWVDLGLLCSFMTLYLCCSHVQLFQVK